MKTLIFMEKSNLTTVIWEVPEKGKEVGKSLFKKGGKVTAVHIENAKREPPYHHKKVSITRYSLYGSWKGYDVWGVSEFIHERDHQAKEFVNEKVYSWS